MSDKMDDVTIPGEPQPNRSGTIRILTLIASGLTTASIIVNVILQIAHFMRKRPVQPDQRDRVATAGLALSLLKQAPGIVKQTRLFVSQVRSR